MKQAITALLLLGCASSPAHPPIPPQGSERPEVSDRAAIGATTATSAPDPCVAVRAEALAIVGEALARTTLSAETVLAALAPFGTCEEHNGRGRWGIALESLDVLDYEPLDDEGGWSGRTFHSIGVAGHPVFATDHLTRGPRGSVNARVDVDDTGHYHEPLDSDRGLAVVALSDLTGDGVGDLLVYRWGSVTPYTFDGTIKEIDTSAAVEMVTSASDLDGDGRIDLFDDSFYTFDFGGKDAQVEVLPMVAHTLPNGTFTRDDAVTRAFYVERCRDLGKPPWRKGRYDEAALLNIACARVFGVDAKTIFQALAREVRRPETDELLSNEGFEAWVSRTPPITLTR